LQQQYGLQSRINIFYSFLDGSLSGIWDEAHPSPPHFWGFQHLGFLFISVSFNGVYASLYGTGNVGGGSQSQLMILGIFFRDIPCPSFQQSHYGVYQICLYQGAMGVEQRQDGYNGK
jgi:hypothetical protein